MDNLAAKELKTKSLQELKGALNQERSKLRDLRFKLSGAQVKNVREMRIVKKNAARIMTIMKSEARNPKSETNLNFQNSKSLPAGRQAKRF